MTTIQIDASSGYQVVVGTDLLSHIPSILPPLKGIGKVAVISDSNVFPLYGNQIKNAFEGTGYQVFDYVFPAGEVSKNGQTYLNILSFLAENAFTRSDLLVALGGGVVGDITGFAAATYLRGVPYIQVPTSLLAMVDSSVGGKTAIDLPNGKNLVGAFYQPKLVVCDLNTLNTLSREIFCDGCAEVIKYAVLYDTELFHHLQEKGLEFQRDYVISTCISLKKDVVQEDEFDRGSRQKLNLGHTFGHAIEANSHYRISHGKAVAIGMAIASKSAWVHGICSQNVYDDICKVLQVFCLPFFTNYSSEALLQAALSDKKRENQRISLILPTRIGDCIIHRIEISELKSYIQAGL